MRTIKIIERVLITIPIMLGVELIVFLFMRLTPGDLVDLMMGSDGNVSEEEVAIIKAEMNLDQPIHIELTTYVSEVLQGDLGNSYKKNRPVTELIIETLPATVELALAATFVSLIIGIPIGVYSAVKQNKLVDRMSMGGSFLGISMPHFWLGMVLIFIFSVYLGWTPVKGRVDFGVQFPTVTGLYVVDSIIAGDLNGLKNVLLHLLLPAITLGASMAAIVARVTRSSMVETLRSDYVTLARAKGVKEWRVIIVHAIRNGLIPTVTMIGLEIGVLLSGNMIVEAVFVWPGLGRLAVDGTFNRVYPLVEGVVMFYAFVFVIAN